jgi:FMN phosphatase YigB (HAD superfamily)
MKTIVWDVDDVLNNLMRAWFEDWSASRPCSLTYERLTLNPPCELLEITQAEYLASLDDFRLSGKAAKIAPVPEIIDWFRRWGSRFHNVALTSAPLCASPVSAEWVMKNFGCWIRSFNIIPSARPGMEKNHYLGSKSEFLSWWGKGDILVDDSEENVAGALSIGMEAVLIPRPWNRTNLSMTEALEALTALALDETYTQFQRVNSQC